MEMRDASRPIATFCHSPGTDDHVVIEEAGEEVAHELEAGAVGLFQPGAKAGDHIATTSSMRCATASVSSG